MSKPVKVSTVLTRAAKWIDEYGLAKGNHWRYRNGRPLREAVLVEDVQKAIDKGCKACTWGGLYIGAYEPGMAVGDSDEIWARTSEAAGYVREVIDHRFVIIPDWNDEPERTKDEVVQALKEAAKAARKDGK